MCSRFCMVYRVNAWRHSCAHWQPPPPPFFFFIKKRSITHLRWLLYLSSVNLMPLALVFVCFSTHQIHLGRWTKAEMAWLPLPPFLLTHKWKRSHMCFPWYDGVFSKCEKRKKKKGSFSTICILKKKGNSQLGLLLCNSTLLSRLNILIYSLFSCQWATGLVLLRDWNSVSEQVKAVSSSLQMYLKICWKA